jgi:hypothetical protein
MDDGLDLNGNGQVDYRNPASTSYGFEEFLTLKNPGFSSASGDGSYAQTIDATKLAEGRRDAGGPRSHRAIRGSDWG